MSYSTILEVAASDSLNGRIQAAAAQEAAAAGVTISSLVTWVASKMLVLAASSGWDEKWEYARQTYTPQFNPDTGARPDVISDADILAAVQPLVLALKPETPA